MHESLPKHLKDGLASYILNGLEPEGFLREVICGNLYKALNVCTVEEGRYIVGLVRSIEFHAPYNSYGSEAKMLRFLDNHPNKKEHA